MQLAAVESTPNRFWPPYCPNPECRKVERPAKAGFARHGHYSTRIEGRRIPRFICRNCRRTMSSQTFAETYRLRHPDLDEAILKQMAIGLSLRKVARILGVNRKTITRRLIRARRHPAAMVPAARPELTPAG